MGRAASKEDTTPATNLKTAPITAPADIKAKEIVLSKENLEYGVDQPCGPNDPCDDEVTIVNKKQIKLKYKIDPVPAMQCNMIFTPATGSIAPGKEKKVKIRVEMKEAANLNFKVTLHIGNEAMFLATKIRCAGGVFGVDPTTLNWVDDGPHKIPEPLLLMKKALIAHDGLVGEGIFRLAGEVSVIQKQKSMLNAKTFTDCDDINTMATLIKVWFRELPNAIMQTLTPQVLFQASDTTACVGAYASLPEVKRNLLSWLLDLLVTTAEHQKVNKMTPQNLAIVVAPNLYDSSSSDPMEGLVLSQKCVQLLGNLVMWRASELGSEAATPAPKAPARAAGLSAAPPVHSSAGSPDTNKLRRSRAGSKPAVAETPASTPPANAGEAAPPALAVPPPLTNGIESTPTEQVKPVDTPAGGISAPIAEPATANGVEIPPALDKAPEPATPETNPSSIATESSAAPEKPVGDSVVPATAVNGELPPPISESPQEGM